MSYTGSNTAERGRTSARRIEGPGRMAGTADDLGTSGSRGAMGARDKQDDRTRPRGGRGPDSPG